MSDLLYVDASAFLRRVLNADGADAIDAVIARYADGGGKVVSSRMLWLEARRVTVRERHDGNDIAEVVEENLAGIERLPVTEDIWGLAHAIEAHVRTLDSLHLATCAAVDAHLLSFDAQMRTAATAMGLQVAT